MISLLFLFLNGSMKALSDLSSEGIIFPKSSSYENKWKVVHHHLVRNSKSPWYYFGLYTPPFKERFMYSSTFLVFLTDGFHFIESLRVMFMLFAVLSYKSVFGYVIADLILLWGVRTIGFTIVYEYFKRRK